MGPGRAIDLNKILGQKYYLHRDIAFESYLKLNPTAPNATAPYVVSKLMVKGLNDLPYSWITAPAPKDYDLPLAYCFKFLMYANCSLANQGTFIASFWRLRDGTETKLYNVGPSSGMIQAGPLRAVTWFEWINATLNIQEGDRLIFRLKVYAMGPGRFSMGLDCLAFPSYILDPATETIYITGDGTNYAYEWPSGSSVPPPHYDKIDDTVSDDDTTFIETDDVSLITRMNRFTYPDSSLSAGTTVNSLSVYMVARNDPNPIHPSFSGGSVGIYNVTTPADYYLTGWTFTNSYVTYSSTYTTNPWTTRAWTIAEINAIEITQRGQSIRVRFGGVWYYSFARDTMGYLVIEYTTAGISLTETLRQDATVQQDFTANRRLGQTFRQDATVQQALNAFRTLTRILSQETVVYQLFEGRGPRLVIITINQAAVVIQVLIATLPGAFPVWWIVAPLFLFCVIGCLLFLALRRKAAK